MRLGMKTVLMAAAATMMFAGPALAQKSKDTLRIAINDPFSVLDPYHFPQDEVGYIARGIYGHLIDYDEHNGKYVPELASSWKRIDPVTLEFKLRHDITFSSGNPFTSADVKKTFDYLSDPKVKIRFKARYTWVKEVQTPDPYTVRIISKKPKADDLSTIAYRYHIYDGVYHDSLENKADYGKKAPTTGPYEMTELDRANGITLVRFKDFKLGNEYFRAPIGTIRGLWMPDRQTQIAQLFTGGVDVLRTITADNARELAGRPGIKITATASKNLLYITMDKAGRSDNKVMTDERVRKAIFMAVNRDALLKNYVAGGSIAERPPGICFKSTIDCKITTTPTGYDPAGAKALLAQAGHPNGFSLQLDVFAPIKEIAEAIAGDLQKVGIKVTVNPMPLSVYVKRRGAGKFTAFVGYYPTVAHPDTGNMLNFFFGANRDYWNDPMIDKAAAAGATELDPIKRTAIYTPALNKATDAHDIYAISELPTVWAHTSDVEIKDNQLSVAEIRPQDFFWK